MFTFFIFRLLKNNLTNLLHKVKNIVVNKFIISTGASVANTNYAIVTLPLVTEKATRLIQKKSRTFTYIYLIYSFFTLSCHV